MASVNRPVHPLKIAPEYADLFSLTVFCPDYAFRSRGSITGRFPPEADCASGDCNVHGILLTFHWKADIRLG